MSPVLLETVLIGIGTYLFRSGSLSLGSRIAWPEGVRTWLSFVTPAVLGALLGPMILMQNNRVIALSHSADLLAALPTCVVAWFTRHLLLTVATGVVCFAIIRHFV